MIYLFWSFAIVWIALFLYLRALVRRSWILEEDVRRLRTAAAAGTGSAPRDGGAAGRDAAPTATGSALR